MMKEEDEDDEEDVCILFFFLVFFFLVCFLFLSRKTLIEDADRVADLDVELVGNALHLLFGVGNALAVDVEHVVATRAVGPDVALDGDLVAVLLVAERVGPVVGQLDAHHGRRLARAHQRAQVLAAPGHLRLAAQPNDHGRQQRALARAVGARHKVDVGSKLDRQQLVVQEVLGWLKKKKKGLV